MHSARKPWWHRATAVVSLSVGGAVTGFSFVPMAAGGITSPSKLPIRLLALEHAARPASAHGAELRSAIVNVASYYLRLAASKTPAEMAAIIWQHDSVDGADHGAWCAAFASMTLELAAQAVGQQSWVTGGTSYPWPLHTWADVRVEPNSASPGIISILQDARTHHRWYPLGDGYDPLPGDWVLFRGHVEVVTKYAGGVLYTVGGDSLPNFSVNAHEYRDPLASQGVIGFVDNGLHPGPAQSAPASDEHQPRSHPQRESRKPSHQGAARPQPRDQARQEQTVLPGTRAARPRAGRGQQPGPAIPGMPAGAASVSTGTQGGTGGHTGTGHTGTGHTGTGHTGTGVPGTVLAGPAAATTHTGGAPVIPGMPEAPHSPPAGPPASPATAHGERRHAPSPPTSAHGETAEHAFIAEIAPGAMAAQRRYGVPASVAIAQAIEESGWGRSVLATRDHNLFGIKGTGPAGSDAQQTREYENGHWVTLTASFRVYHNVAESIDDYGKLLATSARYRRAMAERHNPDAFAAALTGVYATAPGYGTTIISLMRQYDLYRYDVAAPAASQHTGTPHATGQRPAAPRSGERHSATAPQPSEPGSPAARAAASRSQTPGSAAPSGAAPSGAAPSGAAPSGAAPSGAAPSGAAPSGAAPSELHVPGLPPDSPVALRTRQRALSPRPVSGGRIPKPVTDPPPRPSMHRRTSASTRLYRKHIPPSVMTAFVTSAREPLTRGEPLYRDVASHRGVPWELLAACDWMQCRAQPHHSPVCGEKLGTHNPDGTMYRTKSEALEQCSDDLADLAWAVYRIDLTARGNLSVRDLASVFAAFRWGGLLKLHRTSAMEFPYSVAGLTASHINMRWPNIDNPHTPDKPGGRFRMPFGAVPIVLGLNYPATV